MELGELLQKSFVFVSTKTVAPSSIVGNGKDISSPSPQSLYLHSSTMYVIVVLFLGKIPISFKDLKSSSSCFVPVFFNSSFDLSGLLFFSISISKKTVKDEIIPTLKELVVPLEIFHHLLALQ
uniref:Uncharacterized protein n=1 Tax=Monodelphis domestica TaxID=13616 RepID=A0A5F8GAX3_MONDO